MRAYLAAALLGVASLHARDVAAPRTHMELRDVAEAAFARQDYPAALAAIRAALELRPDSPRYLHNAAALAALTGNEAGALAYLRRIARLGVVRSIERDPSFATLQGTPAFRDVLQQFAANAEPKGEAEVWVELPGRTGILEGIAFRPRTGDLFFGDVHHRCIWRRDRDGRIVRWTEEDEELLGIFGLVIDESRNTLWAAMTALPEMSGFTSDLKGHAALAEFDLRTSELRQVIPVPADGRDHGLGDVLVAPDGTVYATDSLAPVIWQWIPGAEEMVKLVESSEFVSLQGMVLDQRTLIVADYGNGLFAIDLDQGMVRPLAPPPNTTLIGIDGLLPVPGGVVAVQNGVDPHRLLRIGFAPAFERITDVTVLASGLPYFTDLALATAANGRPAVISGAGWDGFDPTRMPQPRPHAVRVWQVNLP